MARWNRFGGVNDPTEISHESCELLQKIAISYETFHRKNCGNFTVVIDPAKIISGVKDDNGFSGVIDPAEIRILSIFSANSRPFAKRL
jgi:hypothetical protein